MLGEWPDTRILLNHKNTGLVHARHIQGSILSAYTHLPPQILRNQDSIYVNEIVKCISRCKHTPCNLGHGVSSWHCLYSDQGIEIEWRALSKALPGCFDVYASIQADVYCLAARNHQFFDLADFWFKFPHNGATQMCCNSCLHLGTGLLWAYAANWPARRMLLTSFSTSIFRTSTGRYELTMSLQTCGCHKIHRHSSYDKT